MCEQKTEGKVRVMCNQCNGTAIYSGAAEDLGIAVPCLGCHGKGYHEMTPFTGIVVRNDISAVMLYDGEGTKVPYSEFIAARTEHQEG